MPAFLEAWRAGLYRRDSILRNLLAGLVVGVVALPLAMAFAIASGASPQAGLYTALVAGVTVSLLGGTRVQIAGPTGAFAVLLASVTARYGIAGLQVVTLLAGLLLLALGLGRLGGVIRYIPESVVMGFTAGIGIVIFVGQWGNFFGLPKVDGVTLFEKLPGLLAALPRLDPATTALGVVSLLIVALWPRIPHAGQVPSPMVALVAGTAFVAIAHPPTVATIGSVFGGIPRGLPPVTPPHLTLATTLELLRPAVAVALLGAIESLLSATVADGMTGTQHDPNQELIGQGAANVFASLLGGFAATGAIARTATSVRHGGDSPVAGLAHAATIVLVLVALAPLAYFVPLTTLAAVLFVVAYNMSQLDRVVRTAMRAPRSDVAVMLVTLALAALADISLAVEVGVMLALLNFFRRMVASVTVNELAPAQVAEGLNGSTSTVKLPDGYVVYTVEGPFFFGAIESFESALLHSGTDPRGIVLRLANVPFIDMTGLVALKEAIDALEHRGIDVAICGANADVAERIRRADIRSSVELEPDAPLAEAVRALGCDETPAS